MNGYKFMLNDLELEYMADASPNSMNIFRPFISDSSKIYESNVVKVIQKMIKPTDIFVDVGAYIGYYTCIAGKLCLMGQVYSFEVNPEMIVGIKKQIEFMKLNNVFIINMCVSNNQNTILIPDKYTHPDLSIITSNKTGPMLKVNSISLDEFFKDKSKPNILKIDVEGAEVMVLQGMKDLLKTDLTIILEFHGNMLDKINQSINDIYSLLRPHDYKVYKITNYNVFDKDVEPKLEQLDINVVMNSSQLCTVLLITKKVII